MADNRQERSAAHHVPPNERRRGLLVGLFVMSPVLLVIVQAAFGRHWYPVSDWSVEVLRVGDVGGRHTPLVGPASRFGWYHPGPLLYWFASPFQAAFGTNGALVAAATVNGGCVAGVLWIAKRRGGWNVFGWTALAIAALLHGVGLSFVMDPWNPHAAAFPFLLFMMASWAVSCGDVRLVPLAVVTGSYASQSHVGYAPMVVAVGALCLGVVLLGRLARGQPARRSTTRPAERAGSRWMRPPAVGALVGLVLWAPPILDQLTGHPGNIGQVLRYFRHPGGAPVGWAQGVGVAAKQVSLPGPWLTGREVGVVGYLATASARPLVVLLASLLVCGLAAWRFGRRDEARLVLIGIGATAAGVGSTARVTSPAAGYLVRWWWPVALLCWVAVASSVTAVARERAPRVAASSVVVVVTAALLVTGLNLGAVRRVEIPKQAASRAVAHLWRPTAQALAKRRRYVVRLVDSAGLGAVGLGLQVQLLRRGYHALGGPGSAASLGAWRVISDAGAADGVVTVVAHADERHGWKALPGVRKIAEYDPIDARSRAEADAVERRVRLAIGMKAPLGPIDATIPFARAVLHEEGASAADLERLAAFQSMGDGYVVYLSRR
ncbi:MAG: hypothetical protein JWM05_1355 [Acidimicrobiales bacterium]|nr:hypothetical protein [Acidimicrobiales bacterium]